MFFSGRLVGCSFVVIILLAVSRIAELTQEIDGRFRIGYSLRNFLTL